MRALLASALLAAAAAAGEPAPLTRAEKKRCAQAEALLRPGAKAGEKDLRDAVELMKGARCPHHRLAAAYEAQARMFEREERYPLAIRARADALGLREKHDGLDSLEHGIAEANLAASYRLSGRSLEAIAHYERAKATLSKGGKRNHERVSEIERILDELRAPVPR